MENKLVCGIGVNNADDVVRKFQIVHSPDGKKKRKLVWTCPYYSKWSSMIVRCYNYNFQIKNPTYSGCYVCSEWLTFSNFKEWMDTQDYYGKQLDKDLIILGNKCYSPDTCTFVSGKVNKFLVNVRSILNGLPNGVSYIGKTKNMVNELKNPYVAKIKDGTGKQKHLGTFSTPEEAHQAWLAAKLGLAKELAAEILSEGGDIRVAKALVDRYENYSENNQS